MTTVEMKDVLFNKLQDESSCFKKSEISIKKTRRGYDVVIKGYEHCPFHIIEEVDDYFGYMLWIRNDDEIIDMFDSKKEYRYKTALVYIGYYIGTRF